MNCPLCQSKMKVLNSRPHKEGVWRMRECLECLTRIPSIEKFNLANLHPFLYKQLIETEDSLESTNQANRNTSGIMRKVSH